LIYVRNSDHVGGEITRPEAQVDWRFQVEIPGGGLPRCIIHINSRSYWDCNCDVDTYTCNESRKKSLFLSNSYSKYEPVNKLVLVRACRSLVIL
jgi:hypothetical protein